LFQGVTRRHGLAPDGCRRSRQGLPGWMRRARMPRMRLRALLLPIILAGACSPRAGTGPAGDLRPVRTPEPPAATPSWADPAARARLAAALADADTLRVAAAAPGVLHAYAWSAAGPWAINVLEIDGAVCAPRIEARMPGSRLAGRARTSDLAGGAVAAVNADFFTPTGAPVGAQVRAGEVVAGPVARPVFALAETTMGGGTRSAASTSAAWIGRAVLRGYVARGADTLRIAQVNRPPASAGNDPRVGAGSDGAVHVYTHRFGAESPADSGAVAVRLMRVRGSMASGAGVVASVDAQGG